MKWGLTEEQILARKSGLGGSEARVICHGTPEERFQLWRERIGEVKPKKIMSDWARALRHVTEQLQLDWYEHVHEGARVIMRGESVSNPDRKWQRVTLDGMVAPEGVPINAKHLSRWTKEAREWAIEHYTCSTTHEALVLDAPYGLLSLLHGEKEPEIVRIDVDPFYAESMIEKEEAFWRCIVERVPPEDCEHLDTPKVAVEVKRLRQFIADPIGSPGWVQMVAINNWLPDAANAAAQFAETLAAAKANGAARTAFSAVLPEDIGDFKLPTPRGTFQAKRSAAGALTLTVKQENEP
jgi:hypothetical protein